MFQRAIFLKILDDLCHIRALLAHGHINGIERPKIRIATLQPLLVDAGVVDDGIDANRRLAGLPVANNQLTLTTPNRDHRVHRHDACLYRLTDRLALDDARGNFFHRVICVGGNVALAVNRPAQRIHHAPEQRLAHRH